jgi:hypothetical protein
MAITYRPKASEAVTALTSLRHGRDIIRRLIDSEPSLLASQKSSLLDAEIHIDIAMTALGEDKMVETKPAPPPPGSRYRNPEAEE